MARLGPPPAMIAEDVAPPGVVFQSESAAARAGVRVSHWRRMAARAGRVLVVMVARMEARPLVVLVEQPDSQGVVELGVQPVSDLGCNPSSPGDPPRS